MAEATGAGRLERDCYGWVDLPLEAAAQRGEAAENLKREKGWKLATDLRPHSHHYQAPKQVRSTDTGSGTIEVGGALLCVFHTSCPYGCVGRGRVRVVTCGLNLPRYGTAKARAGARVVCWSKGKCRRMGNHERTGKSLGRGPPAVPQAR